MANIIDSLVVVLGLDPSGFTKGQRDAEAAQAKLKTGSVGAAKSIEDANAKAGESVAALGRKFLGLYALLTAGKGVKEFVADITSADAALGRTAKNLDLSGRNLSAWQNAATVAGGSAEGITGTLKGLTGEMQRAALTGQSGIIPVFRALGINLADARGKARDATDVLVDLNRKAQGMDPARFAALAHMAGIDDGTIALLEKSTAEFDKLIAEQQKYAANAEDIDAAQKRQSGWRQLLITSQSLGRTILTNLTPAITAAMTAVQRWADANQDWIKTEIVSLVERFATYVKSIDWGKVGADVSAFSGNIRDIATAVSDALKGIDGSSPLTKALEGLAVLAGVRLVASFTGLASVIRGLGAMSLPGWLGRLLGGAVLSPAGIVLGGTAAVGAVLASGDPEKAVLDGGHPDVQPQDNDLGLPGGGDRTNDTSRPDAVAGGVWSWLKKNAVPDFGKAAEQLREFGKATGFGDHLGHDDAGVTPLPPERPIYSGLGEDGNALHRNDEVTAPVQRSGLWESLKRLVGFGDDPKIKDAISDTAKATGEIRDLMKAQKEGMGASGPVAGTFSSPISTGASGAGAPNLRRGHDASGQYRRTPSGGGGRSYADTPDGGGHAGSVKGSKGDRAMQAMRYLVEQKGYTPEGAAIAIGNALQESDVTPNGRPGDPSTPGGSHYMFQWNNGRNNDTVNGRRARYERWLRENNRDPNDYRSPLDYFDVERRQRSGLEGQWHQQHDLRNAGRLGHLFEGYGDNSEGTRVQNARDLLDKWNQGKRGNPTAQAPVPAGTPEAAIGDAAAFAAEQRLKAGGRDPKDRALVERYRGQQNTPKAAQSTSAAAAAPAPSPASRNPTIHHAVHAMLHAMAHANKLTRHDNDNHPVAVTDKGVLKLQERTLGRWMDWNKRHPGELERARVGEHAASIARMSHLASAGTVLHHAGSTQTTTVRIGEMHNHTQAHDGARFGREFVDDMRRRGDVTMANGALAGIACLAVIVPALLHVLNLGGA